MQPQNCEEFEGLVEFVVEMEFRRLNDLRATAHAADPKLEA